MDSNLIIDNTIKIDNENIFNDPLLSWLQFNNRVIMESKKPSTPILERMKFLGIADSNLDEFIRTKFRGEKKYKKEIDSQTKFIEDQYDNLIIELGEKHNIHIISIDEIKDDKKIYKKVKSDFQEYQYAAIQPLVLTSELPLPKIDDGSSFIISKIKNEKLSGIIKLPQNSLMKVKGKPGYFIQSNYIINEFINEFYIGKDILKNYSFRIFRQIDNLIADQDNYIYGITKQLNERKNASIEMIDCNFNLDILAEYIDDGTKRRKRKYIYGLSFLKSIKKLIPYTPDMVYDEFNPCISCDFIGESIFKSLSKNDILVHFPYQSFIKTTVAFLSEAANDPDVLSIKMTLYRVNKESPLVKALVQAAQNGKQVIVLIELKAKMDEKNNYELINILKNAGCNIIFGPYKLKTHAKVILVLRKENDKIEKYINISTGNFNDNTADQYEDFSYFTKERSKTKIGDDLCKLFNYLGGHSELSKINDLLISPINFRNGIIENINKCIMSKTKYPDLNARIVLKCNGFTDREIACKLYEASNAGVKINLIVRGMCIIKPKIKGLSENIEVKSILGRFLEHSRIYVFEYFNENGKELQKIYIGSGDMMTRNLDERVEVLIPIRKSKIKDEIYDSIDKYLSDDLGSYYLGEDLLDYTENINSFSVQEYYMKKYLMMEKEMMR